MIALDTNVLVRTFLNIDEDCQHSTLARSVVDRADHVRVAEIIFVESLWLLHKRFQIARGQVSLFGHEILDHERFYVQGAERLRKALMIFEASNIEFTDAVALVDARTARCELYTFDLRLSRLQGAQHVSVR